MSPTNGHANDPANGSTNAVQQFAPPASDTNIPTALTPNAARIKELIASLEIPFHPWVIEWRVTNTRKGGSPLGQVMPYADRRALHRSSERSSHSGGLDPQIQHSYQREF